MHLQIYINLFIYIFGILGFIMNRRNILWFLICLEMLLLSINLNFIIFSVYFDDLYGQVFSLVILIVGAAEALMGLAITIGYYTNRSSISTTALLVGKT